ncbi:MAG: cytochrome oxidase putative small subunit CydP [Methylococcaceae bacterium]
MNKLRLEISVALLIKLLLLMALWFLIFRWQERPHTKPDIAAHFSLNTQAVTFSKP